MSFYKESFFLFKLNNKTIVIMNKLATKTKKVFNTHLKIGI